MAQVSLDAHPRYLLFTDIAAFVIGSILVIALRLLPRIFSPLSRVLMILGLAILFGLDLLLWHRRGIRSLRLDEAELTLYRGRGLVAHNVRRSAVVSVRVSRRLGKRTAVLRLANRARVRIPDGAFPREAFGQFLAALEEWARPARGLGRR